MLREEIYLPGANGFSGLGGLGGSKSARCDGCAAYEAGFESAFLGCRGYNRSDPGKEVPEALASPRTRLFCLRMRSRGRFSGRARSDRNKARGHASTTAHVWLTPS